MDTRGNHHCGRCGAADARAPRICRLCAELARCDVCHGPSYRVSLIDRTIEPLDHGECSLLATAA
ncbi:MAG: hypothetical protein R3343_03715 [Nitriliruptorales bacterium]|nr:hypothetical protein [Nitriliruptorales bacterium]